MSKIVEGVEANPRRRVEIGTGSKYSDSSRFAVAGLDIRASKSSILMTALSG